MLSAAILNSLQCLFYVCFTPFVFVHFYWIYCCVVAHKMTKWCASIHLSCLVHSSVIYSMCLGLCRCPCFSHSLCMAVLQAVCVCWNCEVWVFVAFAVSQALSVSLCPSVCVCCTEGLISLTAHSLSYTHNAHTCAHTAVSGYSASHTHTMLTFFLKCLQTLKYLLPLQVMHDLI